MATKRGIIVSLAGLALFSTADAADEKEKLSFEELDRNRDGRISVLEARKDATVSAHFAKADTNEDGYLDRKEFAALRANGNDRSR